MTFARGTVIVSSSNQGLSGKPRPAIVVQEHLFDLFDTLIVVLLSTQEAPDRFLNPVLQPDAENGLEHVSVAMIQRVGPSESRKLAVL